MGERAFMWVVHSCVSDCEHLSLFFCFLFFRFFLVFFFYNKILFKLLLSASLRLFGVGSEEGHEDPQALPG